MTNCYYSNGEIKINRKIFSLFYWYHYNITRITAHCIPMFTFCLVHCAPNTVFKFPMNLLIAVEYLLTSNLRTFSFAMFLQNKRVNQTREMMIPLNSNSKHSFLPPILHCQANIICHCNNAIILEIIFNPLV